MSCSRLHSSFGSSFLGIKSSLCTRVGLRNRSRRLSVADASLYHANLLKFKQIVEEHSALLQVEGEDQLPVDADHHGICKYKSREDDTYAKIQKRIKRTLNGGASQLVGMNCM